MELKITTKILEVIEEYNSNNSNTIKITLDSGNLLGYIRYNEFFHNYHIMPWDDDIDLACFLKEELNNNQYIELYKLILDRGYLVTVYLKDRSKNYSNKIDDHNIKVISTLSDLDILQNENNEVVLWNVSITSDHYKKLLTEDLISKMNLKFKDEIKRFNYE